MTDRLRRFDLKAAGRKMSSNSSSITMSAAQPFNDKTTSQEVAAAFKDQIKGKNVLVTGVSPNGLGEEVAKAIASNGAGLLICTGRDQSKVEQVFDLTIHSETPSANLRFLSLDLSSLESCKKAANEVLGYPEALDILIANAGTMACPDSKTKEGFEFQFGSNHLGHFYFFNLLVPKVISSKSSDKRIVIVSSDGHQISGVNLDSPGYLDASKAYDKWNAYGQSKTANMLYSLSLSEKLKKHGIGSFSLHPGVVGTSLDRFFSEQERQDFGMVDEKGNETGLFVINGVKKRIKSIHEGASTSLVAAFSPFISGESGSYLYDCQIHNEAAASHARDQVTAEKVWKLSEDLVGEKFDW